MSEEIKIEKGVPMPVDGASKTGFTGTLRKCEVGDSFILRTSQANVHNMSARLGMTVISRKQPDGTFRIWRKS